MKRMIALVLSLVMALSLCTPAWGVGETVKSTLPEGVTEGSFGDNTVTDGATYYATLQAAVQAIADAKTSGAKLYCKPNADVGSLQHAPVTATLTVYGNGATVAAGGERDFDIGNTDPSGGKDITADMTLTVYNLDGCGAWGSKATEHTVNLVFENCQNMGKVYLSGTTGTLNITMTDCSFTSNDNGGGNCKVYSNANGTITLTNCDFSNVDKAVNLNHKAAGTQTVNLTDCTFTNCGNKVAADEIPVRVLTSVAGGSSVLTVSSCTFSGTPEGGADILLDDGAGTTEASISGTAANVELWVRGTGSTTAVTATESKSFKNYKAVAKIGDVEYKTFAEAVAALKAGDTLTLLDDIALSSTFNVATSITIDGNGHKITNAGTTTISAVLLGDSGWQELNKNCNITLKNIVFEGWATEHVVRAQGVSAVIDNCTFQNCKQAKNGQHGLVTTSAISNVTVQNCTFDNNECVKAIHFDDNAAANTLVVKNNTFTKNTVSNSAVIFFGDFGNYTASGNTFTDNIVKPAVATNAGIIYGAEMTVTGNTFKNNSITQTSARGGVVVADAGTIKENIFSGNTLAEETTQETTYVATIVQKGDAGTSIDANANYWGDGKAAVAGEDYVIVKAGGSVTATTYYSSVTADGKLSGLVDPNAPKPPVYNPTVTPETPAEKPVETPIETPTQTPTQPAPSTEVTMGGSQNAVKVEATVTGTTATIDKIDTAQMETAIDSAADTGKVTIDFSAVAAAPESGEENAVVDTVEIPVEVIAQIAEAVADPENKTESLEIVLGDGASIEFDAAALAEKVAQAGGESIEISIKPTTVVADTLSQAQIFTLGEAVAFDITVTSGGVEISDMGGNITISAPYELAEGETAEGIVVYYVDDAGNREKCETVYDAATGRVSWVTNHLSVYMVSYEAPVEDVTPDDGAVDETPVVDDAQSGSPVLWIVIAVVVIAAIVVAVVVSKKRKA